MLTTVAAPPKLAFDRRGSGPPLVLLHPLGADRHVWSPVMERLAAQRDVVCVDLPGFGGSAPLDGDASPPALAAAVAEFVDALGLDAPVHVAGNSLGGWVALEMALGGHARSVTAIAAAGLWPAPLAPKRGVARRVAKVALPLMSALVRSEGGRRVALAATVGDAGRVPPADALRLVRSYATAPGFTAVNAAMRASHFTGLERIRVPVTLAWCERDRLVAPPAHVPRTVRTVHLTGCGHVPMWDAPERVSSLLLAGSRT